MVLSTVWSVHQARWVEGTAILFPLAIAGLVLGMLLARSRLAAWLSLALGVLGGLALCFVVVGGLVPPLAQIPGALLGTLAGTLGWVTNPSGAPPVVTAGQQFLLNGAEFGARIGLWTQLGATGRVSNDNAIFLLFIAYVAWLQGYIGSWGLFRLHDVILAALPTGIALVTNAAYTGQAQAPFAVFFITLLLLAVSTNLASLQKRWERLAVDYPSGLLFDVTVSSFVVICLLAMLAFFGPRISDNPLSNAFWAYMGEQWSEVENASNRLFSGVNSPQSGGGGGGRDRLVLSGPVQLSQRVVMQVQADEPSYWRGATYDTWTGRDWMSSDKFPVNRTEKQAIFPQRFTLRKRVKASFEINQSRSDLIYTPDEPAQVSIPYKVFTRTGDANLADFSSLRAKKPAIPSLKYSRGGLLQHRQRPGPAQRPRRPPGVGQALHPAAGHPAARARPLQHPHPALRHQLRQSHRRGAVPPALPLHPGREAPAPGPRRGGVLPVRPQAGVLRLLRHHHGRPAAGPGHPRPPGHRVRRREVRQQHPQVRGHRGRGPLLARGLLPQLRLDGLRALRVPPAHRAPRGVHRPRPAPAASTATTTGTTASTGSAPTTPTPRT